MSFIFADNFIFADLYSSCQDHYQKHEVHGLTEMPISIYSCGHTSPEASPPFNFHCKCRPAQWCGAVHNGAKAVLLDAMLPSPVLLPTAAIEQSRCMAWFL
jgi:hypothetical protein